MLTHVDEVGRRGDGDRAQLRREPAEGAARARDRACAGSTGCASSRTPTRRRSRMRWRGRRRTGCWSPPRRCARASRSSGSTQIAGFDPWFLERLAGDRRRRGAGARRRACRSDAAGMRRLKAMGFSDARLAQLALRSAHVDARDERGGARAARASSTMRCKAMTGGVTEAEVRAHRLQARRAAGVQADRQLRRRVRCGDALSLLDL